DGGVPGTQTERRGGAGPVGGLLGGKDPTGRSVSGIRNQGSGGSRIEFVPDSCLLTPDSCLLLPLSRLLEPLLVCGRLLPAFVGLPGADQVHVSAEVLLVLAGPVADAVRTQPEVLGG